MINAAIVGLGWWGRTLVESVQGSGDQLTFVDMQIDRPKRLDVPVARRKPFDLEDPRGGRRAVHFTTLIWPPLMVASSKGFSVIP